MHDQLTGRKQRVYRKRKRAEQELATRERITEAAVALHQTLGPARTTVKAIADLAGVQRATVYRHFPDEETLFGACTAHYSARHPAPDARAWAAIRAPDARLRRAMTELYAWYGETEAMLSKVVRDLDAMPASTQHDFTENFTAISRVLMTGRPERGRARRRVAAAIGHAIAFATWRSLTRQHGLDEEDAVRLMAAMVEAAGE